MTYSLTATTWGLIGDATPGGWSTQTNMTYSTTLKTFALGLHLTSGSIKFRGTSDWGVNYGSTVADGKTLDAGGSNIAVATANDYAITLDLSHPNAYTYSANFWGLIGDATSGGWNTDTPMTWNATTKVFTATLNLTAGTTGFKFRANAGWDLNYGGTINALSAGGSNLSVATAGNYTITFDPWNIVATIVKN